MTRHKPLTLILFLFITLQVGCTALSIRPETDGKDAATLFNDGVLYQGNGRHAEAVDHFKKLVDDFPLNDRATEAELLLADSYFFDANYVEAYSSYTNFVTFHPTHAKAPYALHQKGMSAFNQILTPDRDQEETKKALFAFTDLATQYPKSLYAVEAIALIKFCKKRLAENELLIGKYYLKRENYNGAIARVDTIVKEYPDGDLNDAALYLMGAAYLKLDKVELAVKTFKKLINEYPESSFSKKAKEEI